MPHYEESTNQDSLRQSGIYEPVDEGHKQGFHMIRNIRIPTLALGVYSEQASIK